MPRDCDECGGHYGCDSPSVLTSDGDVVRISDMPGVAVWPGCPTRHARLRWVGNAALPLDAALSWLVARGAHRHPHLGSGAAEIYREYLAQRRLGAIMIKARAYAESKRGRP